jgi:hypothetical protein
MPDMTINYIFRAGYEVKTNMYLLKIKIILK